MQLRISPFVRDILRCPVCHSALEDSDNALHCLNPECDARYPVFRGIPVLLNEQNSLFRSADVLSPQKAPFFGDGTKSRWTQHLYDWLPTLGKNIHPREHFLQLRDMLCGHGTKYVLVIGGRILGHGMQVLTQCPDIELVETDIAIGPRTALICDAHDLPFADACFDGVVAQAVMEHVVDPYRCSEEIHRVLKYQGVVYAETPFMQQVHAGPYDFTRFTHLGHRRLFRRFDEVDSGVICGPGMALAWAYQYFLLSFPTTRTGRAFARLFARLTSFPLKYLDPWLAHRPGAMDAASGYYFLGRKMGHTLEDRALVQQYRGATR